MSIGPHRYKKLIKELPKHRTAKDAIIASGFSESTANHQAKRVLRSAVRSQAREILKDTASTENKDIAPVKELMTEILDISSEELYKRIKWLAMSNDKDTATAYKILISLAKQHGITLSTDDDVKVTVPILNLSFGNPSNKEVIEIQDGSTKVGGDTKVSKDDV